MQHENNVHLLYRLKGTAYSRTTSYVTTKEFTPFFPKKEMDKFVPDGMPPQIGHQAKNK